MKFKIPVRKISKILYQMIIDVFRRHSLGLLVLSFLAIYLGKIEWHIERLEHLPRGHSELSFIAYIADDLIVFGILIALVWCAEFFIRKKWLNAITLCISIPVAIVSISNLFWLRGTGSQLSASTIKIGLTRTSEVVPVLEGGLGVTGAILLVASIAIVVGMPYLFRAKWKKDGHKTEDRVSTSVLLPAFLLLLGISGKFYQYSSTSEAAAGWRLIANNVFVAVLDEVINKPNLMDAPIKTVKFNYRKQATMGTTPQLVSRPNILIYLMEATAYRATSFTPGMESQTPFLAQLASRGISAHNMRSVIPHTSKSIFSILCGQYPSMQHEILETADNFNMHCLPELLAAQGYKTAFFQTADGRFEDRPRLIRNMGFDHFEALQDLRTNPQRLGYLAGDDNGVVQPVLDWAAQQSEPFFAVILTSATHHTYEIPKRLLSQNGLESAQEWSFPRKYLLLVHEADRILSTIVEGLASLGKTDDFTLLVSGDHGEAFGEHGGYQHDNILWEEGLHVPFVVWSPNRISPGVTNRETRSLIDVMPTILDVLQVPYNEQVFAGTSILRRNSDARRYFSCWYSNVCVGYVENNRKLVYFPSIKSWISYDLEKDPLEKSPDIEPLELKDTAEEIYEWYNSHRFNHGKLKWESDNLFSSSWECTQGPQRCLPTLAQ